MKKHSPLLFLVLLLINYPLVAQDTLKHCGADEMRIQTLKQRPQVAQAVIRRDEQLEHFTANYVSDFYANGGHGPVKSDATYVIPVVFHVIHNYGSENISEAQILDGLDILNKTFRRQLSDTDQIVPAFQPLHADCDIEFRIATKDPDGNCTNGINRIASPLTSTGDHSVKSLIQWPPNKYLNIYITDNAAGLAGHCVWPSDADTIPAWDGIVIASDYVGTIGTSNYTRSVALAHECGHYLNLHHIWGGNNVPGFYYLPCADPNKDCDIDDLVADTPPTIGWQSCNLNGASCGSALDNVQNTMDYSYCNRMFTYGQMARMHACLNSPIAGRNNLWQPSNLAATGTDAPPSSLCKADFLIDKYMICEGETIAFTNTSYFDTAVTYNWSFPGGTPASSSLPNPTVTYSNPGTYDVTLEVFNATDTVEVTKSNSVGVLAATGAAYPFFEGFETNPPLDGPDWLALSADTENAWELTTEAAYSGTTSVVVKTNDITQSTSDELISKVINLNGASTDVRLNYKYAYTQRDSADNDRLRLFYSKDCGETWYQRSTVSGANLSTTPIVAGEFVPTDVEQWKSVTVSIPSNYRVDNFRFKFVFVSNGGNRLYIDDINLDLNAGLQEEFIDAVTLYPNPVRDELTVQLHSDSPAAVQLRVVNLLGQTVVTEQTHLLADGANNLRVETSVLTAGMYRLVIERNGKQFSSLFCVTD